MKFSIFYSWQSDLPNNTNRGFIQNVIEKSINELSRSGSFSLEISLDRDTIGVPGAPNISQTIIEKIRTTDVFIADVSIVTGDKLQNQRPSPNPNVLIELGYAIAQLGWEKIILFSNDYFGTDEDLPFDIRQHRRLKYVLPPEGEKAALKKQTASKLTKAIDTIIRNCSFPQKEKFPILEPKWVIRNFESGDSKPISRIILPSTTDILNYELKYNSDLERIMKTDGQIDPDWKEKIEKFKSQAESCIAYLQTKDGARDSFISFNSSKAVPISISISNNGNLPASDIRARIPIPDWLICFEKFPDNKKIPKYPEIPVPVPRNQKPHTVWTNTHLGAVFNSNNFKIPNIGLKPDYACYLRGKEIYFWADKLLHKHTLVPNDGSVFLLAKPAVKNEVKQIECEVFCVESDDWEKVHLEIKIE